MKVLVLSNLYPPDFVGGYEIACQHVVDALRRRGYDVLVATGAPRLVTTPPPPHVVRAFSLMDEWLPGYMGGHALSYRIDEAESRLVNAHNVHALTVQLERFGPDVVYVCNIVGIGGLGLMACLQYLGVPWVWQLGDCVPRVLCSTLTGAYNALPEEFSRRIRGHYVVVSEQLRRDTEKDGITLNDHVEVIPNWITGTPDSAPREYYQGGHLRILSAGVVARQKGIEVLLRAASRLVAMGHDDFSIDIFGRIQEHDLIHMPRRLGLEGHVTFRGVVPHERLLGLYRDYDIFAFPTHDREPFGLVPLEAIARGCVPVLSANCGVAEWLVHGVHCLKAQRSAESFAEIFAAVIKRRLDLEPIARRGATAAWRDFHLDAVLPRIEAMLNRAAAQPRSQGGTGADAYRLARIAEQLINALLYDDYHARHPASELDRALLVG